ncbi:MAG: LysR family transcriptional regulator [Betaproteobacteria bacterium]|nr:LysR family transcriptional regulator [Betaproteobacteria bacterium]
MSNDVQFRLRIRQGDTVAVGPGKVALLEAVEVTGSITAAAKSLHMSYRRAWLLIAEMNGALVQPVVSTAAGGVHGGGATLTPSGQRSSGCIARSSARHFPATAGKINAISRMLNK